MTKTIKAVRSRIRITKNKKAIMRGKGHGHLNAKMSRSKQLANKRMRPLKVTNKTAARFLNY